MPPVLGVGGVGGQEAEPVAPCPAPQPERGPVGVGETGDHLVRLDQTSLGTVVVIDGLFAKVSNQAASLGRPARQSSAA